MFSRNSLSKSKIIFSLFSIVFLTNKTFEFSKTMSETSVKRLVDIYPIKLRYICNKLKKVNKAIEEGKALPQSFKNRIILHGPPGNGKTTLARKIAEESESKLFEASGADIVKRYVGDGAKNIKHMFKIAHDHIEKEQTTPVIFIDEVDSVTMTNGEGRNEHLAATQKLWTELDKIKNDPRIVFICATNNFNKLNNAFLSRFGNNKVEINNPNEKTRRKILTHYKKLRTNEDWDKNLLNHIINNTEGFSIRNLEDLVEDSCMIAELENNGIITKKIIQNITAEIVN